MSLILSIETSTKACSSALYDEGELLVKEFHLEAGFVHAERLNPGIQRLFEHSGRKMDELSAVAVSKGPGSYTGLRIGVSTAKGICFALNIPLMAIDTLTAMTIAAKEKIKKTGNELFIPMIDARRMEVYCALFNHEGKRISQTEAKIIDEQSFENELKNHPVYFFGDGMPKIKNTFAGNKNAFFIEDIHPDAGNMTGLITEKWNNKDFENLAYFEPFYLKDFIATTPRKEL